MKKKKEFSTLPLDIPCTMDLTGFAPCSFLLWRMIGLESLRDSSALINDDRFTERHVETLSLLKENIAAGTLQECPVPERITFEN